MVDRYSIIADHARGLVDMTPDDEGGWVSHAQVQELLQRIVQLEHFSRLVRVSSQSAEGPLAAVKLAVGAADPDTKRRVYQNADRVSRVFDDILKVARRL